MRHGILGKSSWKKYNSLNKYSIGIEIQNSGHDNSYENYSINQINSLKKLLKSLVKIYKIDKKYTGSFRHCSFS